MKRLLYTLGIILLMSSCQSLNKMVDSGDYEGAMRVALRKLKGDKRKSTKQIKYLELAYNKALKRDVDRVRFLSDANRPENFDKVFEIYTDIKRRQDILTPILPLVGKDGYEANFKFLKVESLLKETSKKAAAYHYKTAKDLLVRAEKGDKWAAREAFEELGAVNRHYRHFENIDNLRDKALALGKNRVLIKAENRSLVAMPIGFQDAMLAINIKALNDRWTEFYAIAPSHADIDVVAEIEIREFDVSPEKELVREYRDSKEVQDGFEYFFDSNGNVAKDTLGNDIKKPKMVWIHADVIEITRRKEALVGGIIKFYDARTTELMNSKNFSVVSGFDDLACSFRGDRRALTNDSRGRLKDYPLPFPTDESIALQAAGKLKSFMVREIKRFII